MASFQLFQNNLSNKFVVVLIELLMIASVLALVVVTAAYWFLHSSSLDYPIAFILFYFIKFLSDSSLILGEPDNIVWVDLNIFGVVLSYKTFFLSNVDSFCGLLLLSFFYLFRIG